MAKTRDALKIIDGSVVSSLVSVQKPLRLDIDFPKITRARSLEKGWAWRHEAFRA